MRLRTRREREIRTGIKRVGVWIFLAIFVASIVGAAIITVAR